MFVIRINKLALKIMKKNEMTLLPTQYNGFKIDINFRVRQYV